MDDICEMLLSVRIASWFADYGRLDELNDIGFTGTSECVWDWCFFLLENAMEFATVGFIEAYEINTWYFSDSNIMEYYRLCRTYGKAHGFKLRDNPYMLEAKRMLDEAMNLDCCGYSWHLNTKVNHKWASGIVFRSDCYFNMEFGLLHALLGITDWYKRAVYRLRGKLLRERIIQLPALPAPKEGQA